MSDANLRLTFEFNVKTYYLQGLYNFDVHTKHYGDRKKRLVVKAPLEMNKISGFKGLIRDIKINPEKIMDVTFTTYTGVREEFSFRPDKAFIQQNFNSVVRNFSKWVLVMAGEII